MSGPAKTARDRDRLPEHLLTYGQIETFCPFWDPLRGDYRFERIRRLGSRPKNRRARAGFVMLSVEAGETENAF